MIHARIDTKGFQDWVQDRQLKLFGETERVLDRVSAEVRERAKRKFKSHTGKLAQSIHVQRVNQYAVDVRADAPYAGIVHNGSKAHIIRPRVAHAIRFVANGKAVFSRLVHHPGTKGTKFLSSAAEDIRPFFQQLVFEAVERAFR